MVFVRDGSAAKLFRDLGGMPGADQGDVIVALISPPYGQPHEVLVPTTDVEVFDLGVLVALPDGRRMYVPTGNVSAITDAPASPPAGPEA